ncbi:MAG: RNA polymerase sigma factor [Nitrospiraceae bacterium]
MAGLFNELPGRNTRYRQIPSVVSTVLWSNRRVRYDEGAIPPIAQAADRFDLTGVQTPVHHDQENDQELVHRILQGETDRFAELIDRYRRHVAGIVSGHVPYDQVEEVAQDVFVRAFTGLGNYSGQTPFEHWLSGIAVRTCYDFWRVRRRREQPVSSLASEHEAWIEQTLAAESDAQFREQAGRREARDLLDWALARLSAEDRMVLTLVYLEGRSVREAAGLLGWSVVNVKVRAHRAKRAIRKILSEEESAS